MTYSQDFRKKVLELKERNGWGLCKTAKELGISTTLVRSCINGKELKYKRKKPATKIDMEELKKDVETYPDSYKYERAKRFGVSTSGISHALIRLGVSYKKKA
jgi:transposase